MKSVHNLTPTKVLLLLLFLVLNTMVLTAQCNLSCIGKLNISLSSNCTATLAPTDMLSNVPPDCGELSIRIMEANGDPVPTSPTITGIYIGQTLKVMVTDTESGISCWSNVFIEDKRSPQFICEDTVTIINCTDEIPMITATDNCGIPDVTFTEFSEQLDCDSGDYTLAITRVYTATDAQGMTNTCIQQVQVRKPVASDIIFPPGFNNFEQVPLDCITLNADPEVTGRPTVNGQPITDACFLHPYFTDDTTIICEGTTKIFREWKVASWCSSDIIAQSTQLIKFQDSTGPTITCPADTIVGTNSNSCTATITLPLPTALDDCSSTDNITFSVLWNFGNDFEPTSDVPPGDHLVTYTATDDCGNTSTCMITVTVIDDVSPSVSCETFRTVGLNRDSTEFCAIEFFDDGSVDNCTMELDSFCVRRVEDSIFSDCIVFTCDDLLAPVMAEFKICDQAGNCSSCTVQIMVMDNLPPAIDFCPADTTLSCAEYPADTTVTGVPVAVDACGIASIEFDDEENLDDCNVGTVTRTFTVTGTDGLNTSCQQIITFTPGDDPVFTFPENTTVQCLTDTPDLTDTPTATDDCSTVFYQGFEDNIITKNENCRYTVVRTFTFLNNCDESMNTGVQVIEVEDTIPPVFNEADTAIMYTCAEDIVAFTPTATDNCNSEVGVILDETSTVSGGCPDNFTRTEIYIAIDSCGNRSAPFMYTITVRDEEAPTADTLPNLTFSCILEIPEADTLAVTGATDNCSTVTVSIIGTEIPSACTDTIVRTYRITDLCGNSRDLLQNIIIEDDVAPTADPLPDLGPAACLAEIPGPDIEDVRGVSDNCRGKVKITFINQTGGDTCRNTLIRTYRLTDECGNSADITQNILLNDSIAPTADQPDPVMNIQCFDNIPAGSAADLTNVMDNCMGEVTVEIDDRQLVDPGCSGILERTFILTDVCGNTNTYIQQIEVDDQTAPTWDSIPGSLDINADCAEGVEVIPPTATDNCNNASVTIISDVTTNMTCDHRFTRKITYVATDDCTNTSEPFTITVTVFDDEAPTANPLPDVGPFNCIAEYPFDTGIVNRITDNCSGEVKVAFISDTEAPVCMGTIVRTYELSDTCGNTRQITQNILIDDQSLPTADPLDDLGPYACADDVPDPDLTLVINPVDMCGNNLTVSYLRDEAPERCDGTYLRIYQITDECGNVADITQTIIIKDTIPPTLVDPMPTDFYDCTASIPDSILNFAPGVDNCGNSVRSEPLDDDDIFRLLQCMDTLSQAFLLTDTCGNDTIVIRQILINDTVPPVFLSAAGSLDTIVECPIDPMDVTAPVARDGCRFFNITVEVASVDTVPGSFVCASGYTERIGYITTDVCGNENRDTFFVEVTVIDTTPPVFTILQRDTSARDIEPFDEEFLCGEPFIFTAEATDNCDTVTYRAQIVQEDGFTINITGPVIDRDFDTGVNTVVVFAEDDCGNVATDTFLVEVVDMDPPAFTCPGRVLEIPIFADSNQVVFIDNIINGKDDCSPVLAATIGEGNLDSLIFNCGSLNGQSSLDTSFQIFLSDIYGNVTNGSCIRDFLLINQDCPTIQSATVAGQLNDQSGNGIDSVIVEIAGPVISERVVSKSNGIYHLPNLEMNENYEVIPYRNNDVLNGISTLDLVMLGQHLLEIDTLDSPYQLIAADINHDGAITVLDLIALRRTILVIDEEFPNNTSWRFVDSDYSFPDPAHPFSSPFPESRFVQNLSSNEMSNNFMAIKIGDLSGNATSSGLQVGDTRSEEALTIRTEDQMLEAGELYQLSFSADNFVDLKGFQFTIDYDPLAIIPEFEDQLSGSLPGFTSQNIGFTKSKKGKLSVSWHDVNAVTLANRAEVFTLTFRAKLTTQLSKVLTFNNVMLSAEAYNNQLKTQPLQLIFEDNLRDTNDETEFALLQNQPNPFRQQTVIPFVLPKAGEATIEITDINGRAVATHKAFYEAGYQEFTIDKSELNAGGVLFYRLQSGEFEATRKMVLIE